MASSRGKHSYSRQEVLDIVLNDCDSEGPHCDGDSDGSLQIFDSEMNESLASRQSSRPQTPLENTDSDSEESSGNEIDIQRNRGRGRRRARGGRIQAPAGRINQRGVNRPQRGQLNGYQDRHAGDQNVDLNAGWLDYDWINPFIPDWLPEFTAPHGVLVDTSDYVPVDYFKLFFPDQAGEMIQHDKSVCNSIF